MGIKNTAILRMITTFLRELTFLKFLKIKYKYNKTERNEYLLKTGTFESTYNKNRATKEDEVILKINANVSSLDIILPIKKSQTVKAKKETTFITSLNRYDFTVSILKSYPFITNKEYNNCNKSSKITTQKKALRESKFCDLSS